MRPYIANSRYVIFFNYIVCRSIRSEGIHQPEIIIFRKFWYSGKSRTGSEATNVIFNDSVRSSNIFPCFIIFMTLNLNLAIYFTVVYISFTRSEKTANYSRINILLYLPFISGLTNSQTLLKTWRINSTIALTKSQRIWLQTTIWERRSFQTR